MAAKLEKILLVEDEQDIQEVARLSLENIGSFTVKVCDSGKDALSEAQNFKPDLILLDVMMPGMDGLTTLNNLRQSPNTDINNIPVIFMTAKAQANEMKNYISSGAIGAISKPFDPMTLASQIKEIWNNNNE